MLTLVSRKRHKGSCSAGNFCYSVLRRRFSPFPPKMTFFLTALLAALLPDLDLLYKILWGRAGINDHKSGDSVGEPDVLKMVMEGIEGQIQPPEWIQAKDMLIWTDILNHPPAHLCHREDNRSAVLLFSLRWGCPWSADRPIK